MSDHSDDPYGIISRYNRENRLEPRPSWESYFLNMAILVSHRASCLRASVGAVLVKDRRIISTGYNGAPSGEPHCIDQGCIMEDNHCVRSIHAETNAIGQAAIHGVSTYGSTMYVYDSQFRLSSCPGCTQTLRASRISAVLYLTREGYKELTKNPYITANKTGQHYHLTKL